MRLAFLGGLALLAALAFPPEAHAQRARQGGLWAGLGLGGGLSTSSEFSGSERWGGAFYGRVGGVQGPAGRLGGGVQGVGPPDGQRSRPGGGSGGAARGLGARLLVRSRAPARASSFVGWAGELGADAHPDDGQPAATALNATPLGHLPSARRGDNISLGGKRRHRT